MAYEKGETYLFL